MSRAQIPARGLLLTLVVACCALTAPCSKAQSAATLRQALLSGADLTSSRSQPGPLQSAAYPSAPKAFALSMVLPGLGQRYVDGGRWGGWATTFALADAGLWISLFGSEWHRTQVIDSYTTLAAMGANADVDGKDRNFFLNLATYRSSDDFLDTVLRNRAWDQVDYVSSPAFQWNWSNENDFVRYRALREDEESLKRRRVVIIASLVANRVISGVMAAWRAARIKTETLSLQLGPPPRYSNLPKAKLRISF